MSRNLQVSPARPGAYPTISEALGDASSGSLISVEAGTYAESLDLTGLDVTIAAATAEAEVIITGGTSYDAIIGCRRGKVTLRGLTINVTDSDAVKASEGTLHMERCTINGGFGPAIRLTDQVSFTIKDSTINDAQQGLVIEDASGVVDGTTISGSIDDAVVIRLGAEPTLRNCSISRSGHRGIYMYQSAKPTIEGCEITGCRDEGILVAQNSIPIISRCHIHDTGGVGIAFEAGTSGEVDACQVEETAAPGIEIADGASVTVVERPSAKTGIGAIESSKNDPELIAKLLAELDAMVGLAGVKAEVKAIIDEIQVNEWRQTAGLSVDGMSNHLIFAGAPGTGKTTVGRIYGQLLAALGVLPGGPLKEVSRRDLVGQYIGHTAEKTAAVFDEARGGVVFLDEAYTLTRQAGAGGGDFGQEAVDMIVKLMEDMRQDLAVIAAGYTSEMRDFLDANPGLASRFVKTIEFENYSAAELTLITTRMLISGDYLLDPEAEPVLIKHFSTVERDENFGNARDARKLFEKMRKVQSQRLRGLGRQPSLEELQTLTAEDVQISIVP